MLIVTIGFVFLGYNFIWESSYISNIVWLDASSVDLFSEAHTDRGCEETLRAAPDVSRYAHPNK